MDILDLIDHILQENKIPPTIARTLKSHKISSYGITETRCIFWLTSEGNIGVDSIAISWHQTLELSNPETNLQDFVLKHTHLTQNYLTKTGTECAWQLTPN